ncbi:galectin-4-like isoform X2 [Cyprinus carpio]|uniref:Galectin n=1 Tax=Cyprinus carpio TaxID=7962 RepID=A0A9Q9WWK0_CYPCA|nr:galectin-4-like isoform X2 [Cyprinus carpio]
MALFQQLPFFNPTVPFNRPIHGGLLEGIIVTVCGRVSPHSSRFQVDLMHGSDIVLHFNPRYEGGSEYVVHNTCHYGHWGSEERKYETPFPRAQTFALQILVTQETYKISTNGKPFFEYKHRMPFSHVDSICIGGMVELSLVAFQYPAMVPYKRIFCGGVHPGKIFIIQGFFNPGGNRMEISLRHKTGIAFHCSVCFDENVVECNSYEDGKWENGEKSQVALLKREEPMQVTIFSSCDHYKVFVNGEQTHTYSHRFTKLEEIDVLEVSGDVELTFVQP